MRTDKKEVNKRVLEALIRGGAFDGIDTNRAQHLANVEQAMSLAEHAAVNANQGSLFDVFEPAAAPTVEWITLPAWDDKTRLAEEKPALGFYVSGHPFDAYAKDVKAFIKTRLDRLQPTRTKDIQFIAGIVIGVRVKNGERGRMAFVTLDDGFGKQDVTIYSEVFEANRHQVDRRRVTGDSWQDQRRPFFWRLACDCRWRDGHLQKHAASLPGR